MRFLYSIFFFFLFNSSVYSAEIKDEVQTAQTGISERSKLFAELSYYKSEQYKAAADYIRHYLLVDTTTAGQDSIKIMLSLAGYPDPLCKKAAFDIHTGDLASASTSKTFRIKLNATYAGKFYLPTVSTDAMYDNSIHARTPGKWVEVVKPGWDLAGK